MTSGPFRMAPGEVASFLRDAVRSQLWPLPVVGVLLAFAAGEALPRLDLRVDRALPPAVAAAIFGGDSSAASSILDAITTSLMTVTSLTFSLTVVTLQLASSQFSPRLLRTFTSDFVVQSTLAVFLGTYIFALTVSRAVRSSSAPGGEFVPRLSISLAFVFAVVSVLALVAFLAHLAKELRVETLLREVHQDATITIESCTDARADARGEPGPPELLLPDPPPGAHPVPAATSGFLTRIDEQHLCQAAAAADACLVIECHPGSSLVRGVPVGVCWSSGGDLGADDRDRLTGAVAHALHVGAERTAAQDVGFGLRQLTDVVNKALSPAINDPTTAVHALAHISALLCELAGRDLGPVVLRDDDDRIRVVLHRPDLAEHLDLAITQPRRYGSGDPQVLARIARLLEELGYHARDGAPIRRQLDRLRATAAAADFDDTEAAQVTTAIQRAETVLAGRS